MRPSRAILLIGVFLAVLVLVPVSKAVEIKGGFTSLIRDPLILSRSISSVTADLIHFHRNAQELRALKQAADTRSPEAFKAQELRLENERLLKLVEMRRAIPSGTEKAVFARVVARSGSAWNRVVLIDKGSHQGIRVNAPVMADGTLVGKIVETGPNVSKALLVTDPNSRIGALVQRTRHQGILYGSFSGGCRLKYLSVDAELAKGDLVESAGYGGFFPKALPIGTIERVWKEPGQIYQVAEIKCGVDLSRVEEVACLV